MCNIISYLRYKNIYNSMNSINSIQNNSIQLTNKVKAPNLYSYFHEPVKEPEKKLTSHTSAIKALDWSSYRFNYLLSGGGTQDMTLKLWNINTMTLIDSVNTSSQICNIVFSKISHEFITTHGYKNNYSRNRNESQIKNDIYLQIDD